jgi:hypothetical protein
VLQYQRTALKWSAILGPFAFIAGGLLAALTNPIPTGPTFHGSLPSIIQTTTQTDMEIPPPLLRSDMPLASGRSSSRPTSAPARVATRIPFTSPVLAPTTTSLPVPTPTPEVTPSNSTSTNPEPSPQPSTRVPVPTTESPTPSSDSLVRLAN